MSVRTVDRKQTLMSTFLLWTFLLWFGTPVQGETEVIGSIQPIVVAPGDDVILPCHVEPAFDVQGLTVVWSLLDLKPDPLDRLSRVGYVHLYRNQREVPDMKIQSYVGRTKLFKDEMKHGNISLKIMNVTLADSARYRCLIPKLGTRVNDTVVQLVVDPNLSHTSTTETPKNVDPRDEMNLHEVVVVAVVAVVILVVILVAVVYVFKQRRQAQAMSKHDVYQRQPLQVKVPC